MGLFFVVVGGVHPDVSYALISVCVVLAVTPLLFIGFFFRNYVIKGMTIIIK